MQTKKRILRMASVALIGCLANVGFVSVAAPVGQTLNSSGSQQSFKGSEKYFTGEVQVETLFPGNDTAHYSGAYVTFASGAQTAWYMHPAGHHMIVTKGSALTGTRDGKIIEFKEGETGISQGGYSTNIVVKEHFAVHIAEHISFQQAAPLLCAGITTYSPIMKFNLKNGDKVGVAGIGGLGHMAIKQAVSKGADVYAFITSPSKAEDILGFGTKEAIVVDDLKKLVPYRGKLDYMINTIPYEYDVAAYFSTVKQFGFYTQVGMPIKFETTLNAHARAISRVNFNASLIGGMKEIQEMVNYCADNKIHPQILVIKADQINEAWENVVNKRARYRYVIDTATL